MLITAYQQVGEAYKNAVEVSMFAWHEFAVRNVMLLTAAGFVLHKGPDLSLCYADVPTWLAAGLLAASAVLALGTAKQMQTNASVIQRVLGAGAILECQANGKPGHRYFNSINFDDETKSDSFKTTYGKAGLLSLTGEHTKKMGLSAQGKNLCKVYAAILGGLAIVVATYFRAPVSAK